MFTLILYLSSHCFYLKYEHLYLHSLPVSETVKPLAVSLSDILEVTFQEEIQILLLLFHSCIIISWVSVV